MIERTLAPPRVRRIRLGNGMRVLLQRDATDPVVAFSLVFEGGSAIDPVGREGAARLLAETLERGPASTPFVEFSRRFERLGSNFSSEAGTELASCHAIFLARNAVAGLEIVADLLESPGLRADDLDVVRSLALNDLDAREDDLDDVAEDLFLQTVAAGHPYARLPHGRREGIEATTAADLRALFARAFRPDRGHLSLVGDFDEEAAAAFLERRFGSLPNAPGPAPPTPPLPALETTRFVTRSRPEKGQVKIFLGGTGLAASDADRHAAVAWNHVLGASSIRSRLGDEIRDRQWLAYSVYSRILERKTGGFFFVHVGTRPENAARAVASLRAELARAAAGVTAEELADAKSYLTGSFPLRFTTYGRLARFWSRASFFGWPEDYLDRYIDSVNALTGDDLVRAASRIVPHARVLAACGPVPDDLNGR